MDCSLPASSVHGILLAKILEWVAIPFSRLPSRTSGKESTCQCRRPVFILGSGRSLGEDSGNPLQYSCLEISHGQRSLVGYHPWDHKESDTTKHTLLYTPAVETVGWRKGTQTETGENTGVRVDRRGWLQGWKAAFPRKRYINQQKTTARTCHKMLFKWSINKLKCAPPLRLENHSKHNEVSPHTHYDGWNVEEDVPRATLRIKMS